MRMLRNSTNHIQGEICAEQKVDEADDDHGENEGCVGDAEADHVADDKVDVDSNNQGGETDGKDLGHDAIGELPHDVLVAGEGDRGDDSEGKH